MGLVAGIGAAPAATASTWSHSDPGKDVLVTRYDGREQAEPDVSTSFKQGDLMKATVQHTGSLLQVATTLRAFDLPDYQWRLTVVTSRGDRFVITRSGDSGDGPLPNTITRNGYDFECEGMRVNPTSSGVLARVPRACLGTPYRVRVGVQTEVNQEIDREFNVGRLGADDLLRAGKMTRHRPVFSPWIASS